MKVIRYAIAGVVAAIGVGFLAKAWFGADENFRVPGTVFGVVILILSLVVFWVVSSIVSHIPSPELKRNPNYRFLWPRGIPMWRQRVDADASAWRRVIAWPPGHGIWLILAQLVPLALGGATAFLLVPRVAAWLDFEESLAETAIYILAFFGWVVLVVTHRLFCKARLGCLVQACRGPMQLRHRDIGRNESRYDQGTELVYECAACGHVAGTGVLLFVFFGPTAKNNSPDPATGPDATQKH